MGIFNYTEAFLKMVSYTVLPSGLKKKANDKKLFSLLKYAKKHSPYYADAIPDDLDFYKIKPIAKTEFVENFDKIVTDPAVRFENVRKCISERHTEGAKIAGKYSVTMTSGSTGNPTVIVQDSHFQDTTSVNCFFRILKSTLPVIMLGEAGRFGTEAAMVQHNTESSAFVRKSVHTVDVTAFSIDEIIENLKKIGPGTLIGYTGVMTIVAGKLIDRKVKIKEKQIFLSGEKCTEADKNIIRQAFDCKNIRILYGCTEAGEIAHECRCGHLHIMSDCVKIEPVDSENRPVEYGQLSDKLLLTNLLNRVQPIIRYEVTDRITLHRASECPCGSKDDWLEIEGRSNDNLYFDIGSEEVVIPSISLLIVMAEVNKNGLEKFRNFQIAVNRTGKLSITLEYFEGCDKEAVNLETEKTAREFFKLHGIEDISFEFTEGTPKKTQRGKYKRVYMEKEEAVPVGKE